MKKILVLTICACTAGCATAPARETKTCETGGIAAGAGHMAVSGSPALAAVAVALVGLAALACPGAG